MRRIVVVNKVGNLSSQLIHLIVRTKPTRKKPKALLNQKCFSIINITLWTGGNIYSTIYAQDHLISKTTWPLSFLLQAVSPQMEKADEQRYRSYFTQDNYSPVLNVEGALLALHQFCSSTATKRLQESLYVINQHCISGAKLILPYARYLRTANPSIPETAIVGGTGISTTIDDFLNVWKKCDPINREMPPYALKHIRAEQRSAVWCICASRIPTPTFQLL